LPNSLAGKHACKRIKSSSLTCLLLFGFQGEMMNVQAYSIHPVSTRLGGRLIPLVEAVDRWSALQVQVLPQAGTEDCTGWGLFPVLADGQLGICQLLTADERVAAAALDVLQQDEE
jgi:hypothetical protein